VRLEHLRDIVAVLREMILVSCLTVALVLLGLASGHLSNRGWGSREIVQGNGHILAVPDFF
jgi:hypothetical protein